MGLLLLIFLSFVLDNLGVVSVMATLQISWHEIRVGLLCLAAESALDLDHHIIFPQTLQIFQL